MSASQVLTQRDRETLESLKAKEEKLGSLSSKHKTHVFSHGEQNPLIASVLLKSLQARTEAEAKSKVDPFQQLQRSPGKATLQCKSANFAVSHSLEGQIPVAQGLLSGLKAHFRKNDLHRELEQAAQKKQLERCAATIAKEAAEMGDLNAQIQAQGLLKEAKKDVLADVDDIIEKIHLLLHRMVGLVQNKLSDVQKRLEARTAHIEELTSFSNELTKEIAMPGGNGSLNWSQNPEKRALMDKIRQMHFQRSDGKIEKLPLPDGYEWNAEQVTSARQIVDTQKSSMQNMSKKDELEVSAESQRYNTFRMMQSSLVTRWGEAAKSIIRGIGGR